MTLRRATPLLAALALMLGLAACSDGGPADLGPPEGWTAQGDSLWYRSGVDTALAFRDLGNLTRMGVLSAEVYASNGMTPEQIRLSRALKIEFMPLFRNNPEVVDSVFEAHVADEVREAPAGEASEVARSMKSATYRTLQRHFREPLLLTQLGEDVPYVYPDTLRSVAGRVRLQIYVDAEGAPQAIKLLDRVHPTLDALAMQATTQMTWQAAFVRRTSGFKPISSWALNSIPFGV